MCLKFLAELVATNVTSHSGTDMVELSYLLPHTLQNAGISSSSLSMQIT